MINRNQTINFKVFICSPFAGDTSRNIERARRYCSFAVATGYVPYAPHLFFPQFLDENDPVQREQGILMGTAFLADCQELWVFGDKITSGMCREIARARELGLVIRSFTNRCEEVQSDA